MDRNLSKGEILLRQIYYDKDSAATNGVLLNDLWIEVDKGYPVKNILRLLESENIKVNRAGVWVLSELSTSMCCVFDQIKHLIKSKDSSIRFMIMYCVLNCANTKDAESIYLLSKLVEDTERGLRSQALDILTRLEQSQITACMNWLTENNINNSISKGYELFIESKEKKFLLEDFMVYLNSEDITLKKLTFVAIIRLNLVNDEVREIAKSLDEKDINLLLE